MDLISIRYFLFIFFSSVSVKLTGKNSITFIFISHTLMILNSAVTHQSPNLRNV